MSVLDIHVIYKEDRKKKEREETEEKRNVRRE